jgi:hypothetical protein
MANEVQWSRYIQDLNKEEQKNLLNIFKILKADIQRYSGYILRNTVGECTYEIFNGGMTRICFYSTSLSNNDLFNHVSIMNTEYQWKNYLHKIKSQDRVDLFSVLDKIQGDFHMYQGKSPARLPSFLPYSSGKCRVLLNFKNGLTEISFKSINLCNTEIDDFFEIVASFVSNL